MPNLIVSREVRDLIRANADPMLTFRETGRDLPDGNYQFPVSDEVYAAIKADQLPGESISDCLQRKLLTQHGKN